LKPFHGGNIIMGRKRIAGSLIGGIKETQEMLASVVSIILLVILNLSMQDINKAWACYK
jgi:uncharacterized zinc-type alcohol dehydrogenase-like protein